MKQNWLFLIFFCAYLAGCHSAAVHNQTENSLQDAGSALESVAGSLTQKDLTQVDMDNFKKQMRHDKEAREAISTIGQALAGQGSRVKYCPSTGKRYAPSVTSAPDCDTELKFVDE